MSVRNFLRQCGRSLAQLGKGTEVLAQFKVAVPTSLGTVEGHLWGVREACAVSLARAGRLDDARHMLPITRSLDVRTYQLLYKRPPPTCDASHLMSQSLAFEPLPAKSSSLSKLALRHRSAQLHRGVRLRPRGLKAKPGWHNKPANQMSKRQRESMKTTPIT